MEGTINYLTDIWLGYTHSLFSDSLLFLRVIVDFVCVAIILFFVFRFLNTKKGWRYILAAITGVLALVIGSFFPLKGLHVLAQLFLIGTAVALPVLFKDEWLTLLNGKNTNLQPTEMPAMNQGVIAIFAIVLGLLIVFVGNGVTTKTSEFPDTIQVTAVNLANGVSANLGSTQSVTLTVSATKQVWKTLSASSFSATVDLGKQGQGTYDLPINATSSVNGVDIVKISPARVTVSVEPVIKKTVPVVAKFTGNAGNGLVPDSPVITPTKADITGAKSVIDNITQVVAPITLNGETTAIAQDVTPQVLDATGAQISNIVISPATINVKANLITPGLTKTVGIVPVVSGQPASGYWVKNLATTPAAVSITGDPATLNTINQINTNSISVAGITSSATIKGTLNIPQGITLVDSSLQNISVAVTLDVVSTSKAVTPQLSYANLAGSLQVSGTTPTSISAIVSGSSSILAALADGSVKANIDLSSYQSAGTYSVTIKNENFTLPTGVSLVSFLPSAISVTLTAK